MLNKNEADAVRTAVLGKVAQSARETKGTGRVQGKVGIVTGVGPASGIGTYASRLFAREGAKALFLLDLSDALPGFAEELVQTYPNTKVRRAEWRSRQALIPGRARQGRCRERRDCVVPGVPRYEGGGPAGLLLCERRHLGRAAEGVGQV